jgi:hypothetical protein
MKCHFFYEPRRYTLLIGRILLFNTINRKGANKDIAYEIGPQLHMYKLLNIINLNAFLIPNKI